MKVTWWQRLLNELGETDSERDERVFAPLVRAFNELCRRMARR